MPPTNEREEELKFLRQQIRQSINYVEPELKQELADWMARASKMPSSGVVGYVQAKLSEVRRDETAEHTRQYPMRMKNDDIEEDFPEDCHDCPHSPARCPVFNSPDLKNRFEMIRDEHEEDSEERAAAELQQFGQDVKCHQIDEAVREFRERYGPLVAEGWELYSRIEADVGHVDETVEAAEDVEELSRHVDV